MLRLVPDQQLRWSQTTGGADVRHGRLTGRHRALVVTSAVRVSDAHLVAFDLPGGVDVSWRDDRPRTGAELVVEVLQHDAVRMERLWHAPLSKLFGWISPDPAVGKVRVSNDRDFAGRTGSGRYVDLPADMLPSLRRAGAEIHTIPA